MTRCSHAPTLWHRCQNPATIRFRRVGKKWRNACDTCFEVIKTHTGDRDEIISERIAMNTNKCEICPNPAPKGRKTCCKSCTSILANRHRKVARSEVGVFLWHPILDKFLYGAP